MAKPYTTGETTLNPKPFKVFADWGLQSESELGEYATCTQAVTEASGYARKNRGRLSTVHVLTFDSVGEAFVHWFKDYDTRRL